MNKKRPVNLDIGTIRLPITAYVSILHRVSGVVLVGGVILLLWMLDISLRSEEEFNSISVALEHPLLKLILWAILAALAYHLVMGLRHLIMDFGIGESLEGGKIGAAIALVLSAILIILAGAWVWL